MIVMGQLIDQLREMKDFISSLLTNVISLVTCRPKDLLFSPHPVPLPPEAVLQLIFCHPELGSGSRNYLILLDA